MAQSFHLRFLLRPARRLTAATLVGVCALNASALAGCSKGESQAGAQHDESVYALRLKSHQGLPDLDVAFRLTPGIGTAPPTELSAQHFARALERCRDSLPSSFDAPTTLMLGVEGGLIQPAHDPHRLPGSSEDCLASALGGARLLAENESSRTLTIQFARGIPK